MKTVLTSPVCDSLTEEACQSFLDRFPCKFLRGIAKLVGTPIKKYKWDTINGITQKLCESENATLTLTFHVKTAKKPKAKS